MHICEDTRELLRRTGNDTQQNGKACENNMRAMEVGCGEKKVERTNYAGVHFNIKKKFFSFFPKNISTVLRFFV